VDLDDSFHAPMMSQNKLVPFAASILPESVVYLAPVNALRARIPMRFHPFQRRHQAFTICCQRRDGFRCENCGRRFGTLEQCPSPRLSHSNGATIPAR
jgi:hypothetical protein